MGFLSRLIGNRSAPSKASPGERDVSKSEFRAVQVVTKGDCCNAATAVVGKRFLSSEVPMLPLEGCDAADCRCTYELYDDRRSDVRRASDLAYDIASQLHSHNQRDPQAPGRRKDD